jgi:predicted HicB family RNase H-like nuclease
MENILSYKGYEGTAEIDLEAMICRGKILFINDLVTYEASSPTELKVEFECAVDDYLETCKELGREPLKPLKGLFNVRVPPQLHKELVIKAMVEKISLNELIVKSLSSVMRFTVKPTTPKLDLSTPIDGKKKSKLQLVK